MFYRLDLNRLVEIITADSLPKLELERQESGKFAKSLVKSSDDGNPVILSAGLMDNQLTEIPSSLFIQSSFEITDEIKGSMFFVGTQNIEPAGSEISVGKVEGDTRSLEPQSVIPKLNVAAVLQRRKTRTVKPADVQTDANRSLTRFAVERSALQPDTQSVEGGQRDAVSMYNRAEPPVPSLDTPLAVAPVSNRRTARDVKPPPKPRVRDPYFDAVAIACYGSLEAVLKNNSSWVAKAANQLKAIKATLEQIEAFPIWARDRFKPDGVSILITPTTFTKHWPSFMAEYVPQYRPVEKRKRTLEERIAEYR